MFKTSAHSKSRPIHYYQDQTYYFISVRTIKKERLFNNHIKKDILSDVIHQACQKLRINLMAWVVLDNHYHLLLELKKGTLLPYLVNNINSNSARLLNKLEHAFGRKIWHQYWDRCVRNEADFWKHFNYIHHNPVKHGYVKEQTLVSQYKFCSYQEWLKKQGLEWLNSCFATYPIIDFTVEGDDG